MKVNFNNWFVSILITILLLIILEILARIFLFGYLGDSNVGVDARVKYLEYRPFTMWGKDLDRESELFSSSVKKNDFKILLVGGSTAEDFDDYHNELKNSLSRIIKNKRLKILNIASGGYVARQEFISLGLVTEKINPDLIIVIDGANDLIHSIRPGVIPGTTYVDSSYEAILGKPLLAPFIHILQNSQLYNGLNRALVRVLGTKEKKKNILKAEEIYKESIRFMNNYAKGKETPIIFVLQPFAPFSSYEEDLKAAEKFKYREEIIKTSFENLGISFDNICHIDSNKHIKSLNSPIGFSDDVHFKDKRGYSFLSEIISNKIKECYPNLNMK